jgi:H+-transporting ATPase
MITPVGWAYAAWIWLYALAWFFVNDVIKVLTYRMLRREGAVD